MSITAEQAQALKAGITPGPWAAYQTPSRSSFTVSVIGEHTVRRICQMAITPPSHLAPEGWANARAIAAVPDMLATIIAQDARIAELEARENEWRSAFWVADQFAVAIHDDAGKFYSIRAQDFHRMSDLYRGNISETRAVEVEKEARA